MPELAARIAVDDREIKLKGRDFDMGDDWQEWTAQSLNRLVSLADVPSSEILKKFARQRLQT